MIGAVVFVVFFVLFTVISLVINFPSGVWVYEWIPEIQGTQYASWVISIINGVIYGVISWAVFSLAKSMYGRRKSKKQPAERKVKGTTTTPRKRIKIKGHYYQVRQRSTKKGKKGTIIGKWKPKKKSGKRKK